MRSEGSRLLGLVEARQSDIARRVHVTRVTVAKWINGRSVPSPDHRSALKVAYGIPVEAWPDEWSLLRDAIIAKLAEKAPHVLEEIVDLFERELSGYES
jgi:transcriptional regulator with XRE-family HTH domain